VSRNQKLGILLSAGPDAPGFRHAIKLAETALAEGVEVLLYCVDEAVLGANESTLQVLTKRGLKLYVCAYGGQRRGLPRDSDTHYAGLALLSDLVAAADRFVSFR
jgi:sulfur relay (sulfurtransferase) complex TusBCD TusD component (DsrE family)